MDFDVGVVLFVCCGCGCFWMKYSLGHVSVDKVRCGGSALLPGSGRSLGSQLLAIA